MEQRLSLMTLGVDDVGRSKAFYDALGWRGQEVEQTVFYQAGGMAIVLWGRDKLADDDGIESGDASAWGGLALAQNVRSREEVDEIVAAAARAGGRVTHSPQETFYGGYAGYFADPDGHMLEIAHNPGFTLAADGSLALPDFDSP